MLTSHPMKAFSLILLIFLTSSFSRANATVNDLWFQNEVEISKDKIMQSISRSDAAPGSVIASPSKVAPNYYYHWIRDAALTMDTVVGLFKSTQNKNEKLVFENKLKEYIQFSKSNQSAATLTGLGEPKFYVDGTAYSEPWGRPQNDGPALRAITLIHYAEILLDNGQDFYVRKELYTTNNNDGVINQDLEYIAIAWQNPSFDLWEEVLGDHFYTLMVQRKSLLLGAKLASRLGDGAQAFYYQKKALLIEQKLNQFWDKDKGYILATLNKIAGVDYKNSNLDVAVILAVLHGNMGDGYFDFSDQRVLSSLNKIITVFDNQYAINRFHHFPGVAIGRYPEDRYDGGNFNGGNPWVLSTLAVAESFYQLAANAFGPNQKKIKKLISNGDAFIQRVQTHAYTDGSLSEQMDRNSGYMTSAENLTWNYSAILTAYAAKQKLSVVVTK